MVGILGKTILLFALVATAASGIFYFRGSEITTAPSTFKRWGRAAWIAMFVSSVAAFGLLIYLNITSQFQYAYVYGHSSLDLPFYYLISSSWAGQEGSFLLWVVMNSLVGLLVIRFAGPYEAPVIAVMTVCQVFLLSMILGLDVGLFTLGVSPFQTLVEKFPTAPMIQAGVIPTDGQGLNDLLQNYWMVIHPPVLFAGFAAMIVPFAFAVTALWKKQYTQWVRPALPWMIFGLLALGAGIMMGGYWAYETLSFGGYWAWDPVENSSLVPWLVGIAGLHTMLIQKRSGHSQKASLFLAILAYMLVIYSTFLTRSGILGDTSVHAFVDLGMYNQLLVWILTLAILGFGLFLIRYKELPVPLQEPNLLSREFMTFAGAMILAAVAAVILVGTSAPILGLIFRDQPSTVPIVFYNKWVLPLMVVAMFLAGLGQLFWWNKMTVENINKVLLKPMVLSVASTLLILFTTPFAERARTLSMADSSGAPLLNAANLFGIGAFWNEQGLGLLLLLMTFVGFFALYGNAIVMWRIARGNMKMIGGALSHVGFAIMVLGIVASSGFSKPLARITDPQTGETRNNFVLERDAPRTISGYTVTYSGSAVGAEGRPAYALSFIAPNGSMFEAKPIAYKSNKGQWIQNPDVIGFLSKDLFVAVTPAAIYEDGANRNPGDFVLQQGEMRLLADGEYSVLFSEYDLDMDPEIGSSHVINSNDADSSLIKTSEVMVGAVLSIVEIATGDTRDITPVYRILKDRTVRSDPAVIEEWGLSFSFTGMNVDNGSINISVSGADVAPQDWVVVQAYEKPLISFVWIGFITLMIGFCISMYRRAMDQRTALRRTKSAA